METTKRTETGLGYKKIAVLLFAVAAAILSATAQTSDGREFDHRLNRRKHLGMLAGVDFLASPMDVKLDEWTVNVIPQHVYIFLSL
jgi:hypothetical protein